MAKKYVGLLCFMLLSVLIYVDVVSAEVKGDWGASFRLRQEYWENVVDFETLKKPDRDFFRLRSSLWGKADFNQDLGIYARITNEAKYYLGTYVPFETTDSTTDCDRFDEDELFIDNLNFTAKNLLGLPVDLKVGRQDFLGQYGEGFLISDGTPGDGSRSFYFDAVKASWKINPNNSVDLIYINNRQTDDLPNLHPARSDSLPNYHDNERVQNISDEWGIVLYGKNKLNSNVAIEPYYIFKHEAATGHNYPAKFGGPQTGLDLNTLGARILLTAANWTVRGEFAHQFGEYEGGRDREGNGGYLFIGQKFPEVKLKPEWELGYVYLSGDDPKTKDHEGFDPLFSRMPQWNEVFIYTLIYETYGDSGAIPGYWTNLQLAKLGLKLALDPATNLALSYQHLWADEETGTETINSKYQPMFSNDSKNRGDIVTFQLSHAFTKQIDGYFQVEYFAPGDFYADNANDAIFTRWQLQFKF